MFRQFPLSFHKSAKPAAQASLAAHAQGKFWQYHDKLFANQSKLDRASLEQYAKDLGLNMAEFTKAMDSNGAAVDADVKLGGQAGVSGTPSLFINGKKVSNPTNFEAVEQMIHTALKG